MTELSAVLPSHLTERDQAATKPKNSLGKDDFMKLLMAQLTNQDPLKPMEHQEFSAQLAQFGQLEQLTNIGKGIESLQGGIGNEAKMSALSMIGKHVEAAGNEVSLIEGQGVSLNFGSKPGVMPIKAAVYTEGGKLIRELEIDSRKNSTAVAWDGMDLDGKPAPSGKYNFRVNGVDEKGQAQDLGTQLSGRVISVDMAGKNPILIVETPSGNAQMELSKVKSVAIDKGAPTGLPGAPSTVSSQPPVSKQTTGSVASQSDKTGTSPIKVDMSALEAANEDTGNGPELEDQWQGFPPFASFQSLK